MGRPLAEQLPQLHRVAHFGDDRRHVAALAGIEDDAEDEDGEDGTHGAEGHEAEAVVRCMAVGTDGRHTDAQRHDEGTVMGPVVTPPESKATARNSGDEGSQKEDGSA